MPTPRGRQYRFSDHFGIAKRQSQLDFVDVPLNTDINLYVDPYALHVSSVDWLRTCGDLVVNYFQDVLESIRSKDGARALLLLANLKEPNETRLGQSKGKPAGRGWGKTQTRELYNLLSKSKAVASGRINDLDDFELLVPGIGSDKISDLTINVIRGELVSYTQEQCDLYGIPTEQVPAGVYWNPDDRRWESHYAQLPVYEGQGVILVPKVAVRRRLVPDPNEYYTYHVLPFLEAEHLHARDSLVHTLRSGDPRVYKKDLRAEYRLTKEFLFTFSEKHPNVLSEYKKTLPKKASLAIENEAIESRQYSHRPGEHNATAEALASLAPGLATAGEYHNLIVGALNEIFYPVLTRPSKERSADDGRKRIDISFHNTATDGFFARLVHVHHYHAPYISVECKNYSKDPNNPEFDQLLGRLNRKRGFVGILTCRKIEDKQLVLKRCRDVVNNSDKHLILVLDDSDIVTLLGLAEEKKRKAIDDYLEDKLKQILD